MEREFYVYTPLGKLRVWAKHTSDDPDDFPGVYVDLVSQDGDFGELLACVEYDSIEKGLQTCVYQPYQDAPASVVKHDVNGGTT